MGKFLVESGAIAPNATPQLRRWSIKKIKLSYPQITSDTLKKFSPALLQGVKKT